MRYVSRAVPFAIAVNLFLGLLRLLEPHNRYLSAGYDSAKQAWSIHWWGAVFVSLGVALFLLRKQNALLRVAAFFSGLFWFLWGSLSAISAYYANQGTLCTSKVIVNGCHIGVSYGGAVLYLYVCATHALIVFQQAPLERRTHIIPAGARLARDAIVSNLRGGSS